MPGAYVETLNAELWDSPDMLSAGGYHNRTYFHGPIKYLTLYPLALLDSFKQIAALLLPGHAAHPWLNSPLRYGEVLLIGLLRTEYARLPKLRV